MKDKLQKSNFLLRLTLVLSTTGLLFLASAGASEAEVIYAPTSTFENEDPFSESEIIQDSNYPFSCWYCNTTDENDACFNLTEDFRSGKHVQQCLSNEQYCKVERVWYIFGMNKTEFNFSIYRHCSSTCKPHCLIMGDRTKIYSCSTCCQETLCNTGSSAERTTQMPTSFLGVTTLLALSFVTLDNYRIGKQFFESGFHFS